MSGEPAFAIVCPGSALLTACERWTLRSGFSDKGLDVCPYYEPLAEELGDDLEDLGLEGALSLHFADQAHNMDAEDLVNHQRAGYLEAARDMAALLYRLMAYRMWPPDVARHLERERDHLLACVARGRHTPLHAEAPATARAVEGADAAPSKNPHAYNIGTRVECTGRGGVEMGAEPSNGQYRQNRAIAGVFHEGVVIDTHAYVIDYDTWPDRDDEDGPGYAGIGKLRCMGARVRTDDGMTGWVGMGSLIAVQERRDRDIIEQYLIGAAPDTRISIRVQSPRLLVTLECIVRDASRAEGMAKVGHAGVWLGGFDEPEQFAADLASKLNEAAFNRIPLAQLGGKLTEWRDNCARSRNEEHRIVDIARQERADALAEERRAAEIAQKERAEAQRKRRAELIGGAQ